MFLWKSLLWYFIIVSFEIIYSVFLIFPHHMYIEQLQLLSKSQHILFTFIPDEVRKIMI